METGPKLGPVGQRLAKEVARLRARVPVRELSERLKALGRPILPSGITKIEQGQRRVDVDDLVALALALGVTPNRLLFGPPPTDGSVHNPAHDEIYEEDPNGRMWFLRLASELALEPWAVWEWALGQDPLGEIWRVFGAEGFVETFPGSSFEQQAARFRAENTLPPLTPVFGMAESVQEVIGDVGNVVSDALDQGLTEDQILQLVKSAVVTWGRDKRVQEDNVRRYQRLERGAERGHARLEKMGMLPADDKPKSESEGE